MSARVGTSEVAVGALRATVTSLQLMFADSALSAWLEDELRADGLSLRDGDLSPAELVETVERWPEGRVFSQRAELRWTRRGTRAALVVVSDDAEIPADFAPQEIAPLGSAAHDLVLLWGEYTGGRWRETRIPALHSTAHGASPYPTAWRGPYAGIRTRTYRLVGEGNGGTITRFVSYAGSLSVVELEQQG